MNIDSLTIVCLFVCLFVFWRDSPQWARASSFTRFLDHTQRRTTAGRTPLNKWSDRRRDLYLTTHNTHNRQTSMPPVGFEPTISAGERLQAYALDRAAAGTGQLPCQYLQLYENLYQPYACYMFPSSNSPVSDLPENNWWRTNYEAPHYTIFSVILSLPL